MAGHTGHTTHHTTRYAVFTSTFKWSKTFYTRHNIYIYIYIKQKVIGYIYNIYIYNRVVDTTGKT